MPSKSKQPELGPRKARIVKTVGQLRDNHAMAAAIGAKAVSVQTEDLGLLLDLISDGIGI